MRLLWFSLLGGIFLTFCGMIYLGFRSWPKISSGKRIASILLLTPHLLLIVCILVSLACGHPAQGSACWNRQFLCGVFIVFILPLPTLIGTLVAFVLMIGARKST